LYSFWISLLSPNLKIVDKIEDLKLSTHFCIESSYGHPFLKESIDRAVNKIAINKIKLTKFFIIVDSEENPPEFRKTQYETYLKSTHKTYFSIFEIVVQPICIESWLLGNPKIFPKTHNDLELKKCIHCYDTSKKDPERLPKLEGQLKNKYGVRATF